MKPTRIVAILFIFSLVAFSCKKEAGPGGTSFIKGKVFASYYDKKLTTLVDSAYAADVDVYIIYGGQFTYGDHQKTSYDGSYEFTYLEKGSYKVYTYSKDTTGLYKYSANQYAPNIAVVRTADITTRKQTVELPVIRIIQ